MLLLVHHPPVLEIHRERSELNSCSHYCQVPFITSIKTLHARTKNHYSNNSFFMTTNSYWSLLSKSSARNRNLSCEELKSAVSHIHIFESGHKSVRMKLNHTYQYHCILWSFCVQHAQRLQMLSYLDP